MAAGSGSEESALEELGGTLLCRTGGARDGRVCEGGLGWWFEATLLCKSQVWIWVPNAYLVW